MHVGFRFEPDTCSQHGFKGEDSVMHNGGRSVVVRLRAIGNGVETVVGTRQVCT